jgi:hypothetical protein
LVGESLCLDERRALSTHTRVYVGVRGNRGREREFLERETREREGERRQLTTSRQSLENLSLIFLRSFFEGVSLN